MRLTHSAFVRNEIPYLRDCGTFFQHQRNVEREAYEFEHFISLVGFLLFAALLAPSNVKRNFLALFYPISETLRKLHVGVLRRL